MEDPPRSAACRTEKGETLKGYSCDHEDCREPDRRRAYVVTDHGTFCVLCYLIFDRGMDPNEAHDVMFEENR